MGIHASATDLIAARTGYVSPTKTRKRRAGYHDTTSQTTAHPFVLGVQEKFEVHGLGLETVAARTEHVHLYAHCLQQVYELIHVHDIGNVVDGDRLGGQQHSAQDLQRLVLGTLWHQFPLQSSSSFNTKASHGHAPGGLADTGGPKQHRHRVRNGPRESAVLTTGCCRNTITGWPMTCTAYHTHAMESRPHTGPINDGARAPSASSGSSSGCGGASCLLHRRNACAGPPRCGGRPAGCATGPPCAPIACPPLHGCGLCSTLPGP